ncbi:MAG: hypothetical protein HYU55_18670, partial [Nocardioides sp.]|nr:hypothetical protein [Nocardioides sp.]
MTSPQDLHARGVRAMNRGRHREARRLFEQARRELHRLGEAGLDLDLDARVASSLAYVLSEPGAHDVAMRLCRDALAQEGTSSATRGVLHSQVGLIYMLRGETANAVEELDAALVLVEERAIVARIHLNRGNVHLQRNRLPAAAADFARAYETYLEVGDEYGAAKAVHNLGYTHFLEGDLVAALHELETAYPAFEAEGPVMTAMADQDRAEVLMAAGLHEEGSAALAGAANAYGRRRLHQRRAEAELALARSLVLRDPVRARAAARDAVRRFRRTGARAWEVRAEATLLSAQVESGRAGPALVAHGVELADALAAQGLRWEAALTRMDLARIHLRRGQVDQAAAQLASVGGVARAPLAIRLRERDLRGEVAAARRRPSDAMQHLRAGLADLHAWQSSFGSLDLQTGVVGHGVRLGTRGLALAVESRRAAVLFEWSERARMLASRVQPVRAPEDEQIVADLAELRDLAAAESKRDGRRESELRQRVRERAWQHRGSGAVADPVTLAELQTALDAEAALVAYVVAGDQVVALVVTAYTATWVGLGERERIDALLGGLLPDLDVAAADLPDAMAGFVRTALADRLAALASLLAAPVLDAVGDRQVVLTPSGVLAGVPWTLLPGFVGRPVTVAQSATSWLARRTTPLRLATAGFVAGPRVARAEDEVVAAAKEWKDARVLTGSDASAAAVSELAASVDVLHVAAHG